MSLTRELDKPGGIVRAFIDASCATNLSQVKRSLQPELRERLRSPSISAPPEVRGGALGTVGHALDYRVRFSFEPRPRQALPAQRGAMELVGGCSVVTRDGRTAVVFDCDGPLTSPPGPWLGEELERRFGETSHYTVSDPGQFSRQGLTFALVREFFSALDSFLQEHESAADLSDDEERMLSRYCLVLGLFEEVYRAAGTPYFDSPLLHLEEGATLDSLLTLASDEQVADVYRLWQGFVADVGTDYREVVCNPSFAGSRDVGGADADFILDHCLLELKTSARPDLSKFLRQLLGYVLLDYEDDYAIREVAVYLARFRCLASFSLQQLLLGEDRRDDAEVATQEHLSQLRGKFRTLLQSGT